MRRNEYKNIEWGLLIVAIILSIIGVIALFSATQETGYDEFKKQIIWLVISLVIMVIVTLINYETLVKLSPIFYGISIILLIAVLFTKPINGATSWFDIGGFSLQPSEFAKVAVILFLAFIIPALRIVNKDASIIIIRDILRSLNKNSLSIIRLMKKKSIMNEINKISSMVETSFILISLLRVSNILINNGINNSSLNSISNLIGIIFTLVIIYKIAKVIYTSKKLNINSCNKNSSNENNTKGKVINFHYFK